MAEIRIELDVPARMRDGTVLRADVYRPDGAGPWPVLLSRLPYGKQTPMMTSMLDPTAAARRGFMVVLQDTRGRFASDGEWDPFTAPGRLVGRVGQRQGAEDRGQAPVQGEHPGHTPQPGEPLLGDHHLREGQEVP
ncbi:hypothetical protein ABIE67_007491 [Streptomyces sp. V4I8]|uniref:CocE/NonD family hydrolase n=1 Tax=Streptomyces sp. V4I8 TaxID=3156469 RepID=UPI003515D550